MSREVYQSQCTFGTGKQFGIFHIANEGLVALAGPILILNGVLCSNPARARDRLGTHDRASDPERAFDVPPETATPASLCPAALFLFEGESVNINPSFVTKQNRLVFWVEPHPIP